MNPNTSASTLAVPFPDKQVVGVQHTRVGEALVTTILDGYIDVLPEHWINFSEEERQQELRQAFLDPAKPVRISINAYLINTGDRLIAIDTGADTFFGPTGGRYAQNLAALGIRPEAVDTVLLTHLHPDHIGGLIAGGETVFPNAQVVAQARDHNYWMSSANQASAPEFAKTWFDAVQSMTRQYGDRLRLFEGEQEVIPGFHSISLFGHTPGHSGFVFTSAGERLFFWADTTDQTALQLNRPERALIFDVNPADGAKARQKAIELAASEHLMIAGSHVPFPSFGHIDHGAGGYRYVPAEWQYEV